MRSTAYSLFMTMLLLIPIAAVPLMAIFGVPQFTPIVSSPLAKTDDEDWDRPARKKPRPLAKAEPVDDQEFDVPVEETLNWDEAQQKERPRPLKKIRPTNRTVVGFSSVETDQISADQRDRNEKLPLRTKKLSSRVTPREPDQEDSWIQNVANESAEEESSFVQSAVHFDAEQLADQAEAAAMAKIPGYRRQRPGSRDDAERAQEKSLSRSKGTLPSESLTWKKAVQRLNELGIRNFRLEPGDHAGEFTFTCSYTPSNLPHVTRKFEAEADDPLKAVAKVLAQVEEASQQRVLASPRRLAETGNPRDSE